MKRITAAALAATTALSLAAVPAQAEEGNQKDLSEIVSPNRPSDVTDRHLAGAKVKAEARERLNPGTGYSGPYKSSSEKNLVPKSATSSCVVIPSAPVKRPEAGMPAAMKAE